MAGDLLRVPTSTTMPRMNTAAAIRIQRRRAGARGHLSSVPVVSPAGLVKTQSWESLPQEMRSWLEYSRRRSLVAQQKLPAAVALLTYLTTRLFPIVIRVAAGILALSCNCASTGHRNRSRRLLPLAIAFQTFFDKNDAGQCLCDPAIGEVLWTRALGSDQDVRHETPHNVLRTGECCITTEPYGCLALH